MPGLSFSNELISRDEVCYPGFLLEFFFPLRRTPYTHCHVSHRAYTAILLV